MTRPKPMTATRVLLSRWKGVSRAVLLRTLHEVEAKANALQQDKNAIYTERVEWERTTKGLMVEVEGLRGQLADYQRAAANEREKGHFAVVEAYQKALRIVASKGLD